MPVPFSADVARNGTSFGSCNCLRMAAVCFMICCLDSLSALVSTTAKGSPLSRKKSIMCTSSGVASWRMSTSATTSANTRAWLKYPSMSSDQRPFSDFDTLA